MRRRAPEERTQPDEVCGHDLDVRQDPKGSLGEQYNASMTPLAARPMQPAFGVVAAIGLGSNLGDRLGRMHEALDRLAKHVRVVAVSSVYETEPMIVVEQPRFYNAACWIETDLSPRSLVGLLKQVEQDVGRQERTQNGPREIDLDLLTYGVARYRFSPGASSERALEVPHPRIPERRFVLAPLAELDPNGFIPGLGTIGDLLARTESDASAVRWVEDAVLSLHG